MLQLKEIYYLGKLLYSLSYFSFYMGFVDKLVEHLEKYIGVYCLISWGFFLYYISQNNIIDFGTKFTTFLSGLLAFTAVFYTVMIVSKFVRKLNRLRQSDIKRLKRKAKTLINQELDNLNTNNYEKCSDLINEKIDIYGDLVNLKNRTINKSLFISVLTLIVLLVIDSNFAPRIIFGIQNYKPFVLLSGLFFVIYHIVRIIIQFFRVFTD